MREHEHGARDELGLYSDATRQAFEASFDDPEDAAAPQRNHLVRRLFNIEKTVELIQNALLEAAEAGETRHEHLLAHLERLQDDVSRNQSMLQEMRRRGCVRRECVFLFVVLGVALWLYVVHALTLE